MPNFLQVLHWKNGFSKVIEIDGQEAVSAELQKVQGRGESIVAGGQGNTNRTSGSGSLNKVGGSGSSKVIGGRGGVCG